MITVMLVFSFVGCDNGNDDTHKNPESFNDITAAQLVANIKIGWNLGNTLDATDNGEGWIDKNSTVTFMETCWGNPVTTKANITAIKNAGFNAIRIPVSWDKAVDSNYNIRGDWMKRVTEVVNYAVDNDMYILLNTHHDEHTFKFTNDKIEASLAAFKKIWEQIADNFKNHNEKLIFEGLNEPRTKNTPNEWSGGTPEEHNNLNSYYRTFVETVRASGGNNDKRILMITTYAASASDTAVNALTLPTDTVSGKLIVSIHAYTPYNFALNEESPVNTWSKTNSSDTKAIQDVIQPAYDKFVSKGIPVIMGEFGAGNKDNAAARGAWAEYYVGYAKSKGIACFYWDDGGWFKLLNRSNDTFYFPEVLAGLMDGANSTFIDDNPVPVPNPITGNLGNYHFGIAADSVSTNYTQAVWELTGTNLTTVKQSGAQLVLALNAAPTAVMQLVWQGPANAIWWEQAEILGNAGNVLDASKAAWNDGTKTLTINLAAALADYSTFTAQPSLNIIIAYYGGGSINDLGIVSADISN
ncbi:MAG: glycoside hydrolase family 5 protein [Treponema sp.]|nr:glycoside hydrolase family 5 protein [Treponema sp.]